MTIGIMQPYWMPYLGYFQLMTAVDMFVYYDDVTYIKQGWINRNNAVLNGQPYRFVLELKGASSFKNINEIEIGNNRPKLLKTFLQGYGNAPYFNQIRLLLIDILSHGEPNLFKYILYTHRTIFNYLDVNVECLISSLLNKDNSLKSQKKVLNICKNLGATTYINAIGGQMLYSKEDFKNENIDLFFLKSGHIPTTSIIDVLMNYSPQEIRKMLSNYDLL